MKPSPSTPAVLYVSRLCFPAVGNQLMSRGGRDFLLVVKGDLAEELWNTRGTEASSSERSLHAVFLDCSSHVYNLHQKNGFTCMLIGEIFELM